METLDGVLAYKLLNSAKLSREQKKKMVLFPTLCQMNYI